MAADWSGMESALKDFFEELKGDDDPSFMQIGSKIAGEYAAAISQASDGVGHGVTAVPGESGVASAFANEFKNQMADAAPSFASVITAVGTCNKTLVLAYGSGDSSVSMVSSTVNVVTNGGTGNANEYKSAFAMSEDMTAAKSAELITKAMKNHFSGNATLLTGVTSAPSPVTSTLSLS